MPIFTKKLFAEDYVVSSSVVSMSIAQASGSTIFGDTLDDTHRFTGSLELTGSAAVQGDLIISSSTNGSILKVKTTTTNADALAQFDTDGMTVKVGADGHSGTYREGMISVSNNRMLMFKLGSAGEDKRVMFGASGGIGLGDSYALETATLINHGIKAEGTIYSDANISGSATSTGSFGHLLVNGSELASSPDATDGSQSLISGSTDSTGSFGRIVLDGHQNPKINFKDNDISLGEDALLGTGNSHNVAIGYRAAAGSTSAYQVAIGYLALSGSGASNNHNVAIGTETLSTNIDSNNYHNVAIGGYALQSGSYRSATAVGYAAAQKYTGTTAIVAVGLSAANAVSGNNITAIGANAMNSTGSATNSVAVGTYALSKINSSTGGLTAVGYFALRNNTTGYYNVAIGPNALEDNTTANQNIAIGYFALNENTTGNSNIAIGTLALRSNTTGTTNVAIGNNAMRDRVDSDFNVAIGSDALYNDSTGGYNVAIGVQAGYNNKADNNVMIGQAAGYSSGPTDADLNVFVGRNAGRLFISGSSNVAIGESVMYVGGSKGADADENVAVGKQALYNVSGHRNVGVGRDALFDHVSGDDNVAVGYRAGRLLASGLRTSGSDSIYIGQTSKSGTNNSSNEIVIGSNAIGKGSNTVVLGDDNVTDIYLSEDKGAIVYGGTFSGSAFIDDGTQLNVPDYVFEPEYDLKSLEYVETHISQSKHLPGVPSRDDKQGWVSYDMGSRDMLLLEKIEELTLYVIRLEKRIKDLENN